MPGTDRSGLAATIGLVLAAGLLNAPPAPSAIFTVDVFSDGVDDDINDGVCQTAGGNCTLRAAVQQASVFSNPPHTIRLPSPGTYVLDICCDLEDAGNEGDLDLDTVSLEIVGLGPLQTVIEQTVDDRVLHCESSNVSLRNLTITGGIFLNTSSVPQDGAGLLFSNCTATLDNVVVDGNSNGSDGFGANVTLLNSNADIRRSAVLGGNGTYAGGIAVRNSLQVPRVTLIEGSLIAGNFQPGLYLEAANTAVTLRNSTLSENSVSNIRFEGGPTLTLEHVTLLQSGGSGNLNVKFDDNFLGGTMTVKNSLLQHLSAVPNCDMGLGGITISEGYNIDSSNSCHLTSLTDSINTDALLENLADNGGPTETHALPTRSPAINFVPWIHGLCNGSSSPVDQRDAPRVGDCDAGAYEYLGCPVYVLANELIFGSRELYECAVRVGPEVTVTGGSELILNTGTTASFTSNITVEQGAQLSIWYDPVLQLVLPSLVDAERRRRGATPGGSDGDD